MGRLDFAPRSNEIRLTDVGKSIFSFTPKPDQPVSFAALGASIDRAGYALYSAEITVAGTLAFDGRRWALVADPSGQSFTLDGKDLNKLLAGASPGERLEVTGGWKTVGRGEDAREVVSPHTVKTAKGTPIS